MEKIIKDLLSHVHETELKHLVTEHITSVHLDETTHDVVLTVDKQYVINELESAPHMEQLETSIKSCFWDESTVILRLDTPHHWHDREMNIPHNVHR